MRRARCINGAVVAMAMLACTVERHRADDPSLLSPDRSEWQISENLRVIQLRPDVWIHTSWKADPSGSRFSSNGLIVKESQGVTLVDTAWGVDVTSQLLAWVTETLRCTVTRAVITHSHDDRSAGIPALLEKGIPVFAEPRTVALDSIPDGAKLKTLSRLEVGQSSDVGPIQLLFPGPGHSPDNVVAWLPAQRILFGGCLVKAKDATTLGNTNDADVVHWSQAIALLLDRFGEAEVVVPGHGAAGGRELLDHTQTLLRGSRANRIHPMPVILDTDIGSDIDDTWALVHLLKSPELELKLILTTTCDTEYRARLVARLLEVAGRTDIPVGMGPQADPCNEFQKPWLADFSIETYPGRIHRDGIQRLIDIVHASPVPVIIIALGPVGNIAEALRRDPSIAAKARYVGMQGSIDVGYGEGPPVAEANVRGNPAAFRTVLEADWLDLRITPLDTCGNVILDGDPYQRIQQSDDPRLRALIENYRIWSQLVTWIEVDFFETRSSTLFDLVATYMAYTEEHLEFETIPIKVTEDGMTVRDPAGVPTRVAMRWKDQSAFLDHLTDRLTDAEAQHQGEPSE